MHLRLDRLLARDLADYDQTKYNIYVIPTNPDGQLRFHWGEPITVVWRSPLKHSRRDWVGIYRVSPSLYTCMRRLIPDTILSF